MKADHLPRMHKLSAGPPVKNLKGLNALFLLLSMLCLHPSFAQSKHNIDIANIKSNRAVSNDAIAKHDVKGIAQFWLDDFVQVIGRGTYETGKGKIAASWQALFNSNSQVVYVRTPENIIISDNDTMAWESGKWTGIHTYSKGGNYSAMWIKRNGNWMLKAELFVSLEANKHRE
ncbi:MAG: YybH family protein [Ginsengibacter sp.]